MNSYSPAQHACPVCTTQTRAFDVVDFNKSAIENEGKFLPLSGEPVYYFLCDECGFCFAPTLCAWSMSDFENKIYNDAYVEVDPDYLDVRPRANAQTVESAFGEHRQQIRHLDYGGGNGQLSALLRESGWQSISYDPFSDRDVDLAHLGRFDLITSFEVFEHVPDPKALMRTLSSLLEPVGLILFSTLVSDGHLQRNRRLDWWYAAPRNGHISLYSTESLNRLASEHDLLMASFSPNLHLLSKEIPIWAQHLIRIE